MVIIYGRRGGVGSHLLADRRGAQLVEYVLLVGVVALAAAAGFRAFGEQIRAKVLGQAAAVAALDAPQSAGGADDEGGGPGGHSQPTQPASYGESLDAALATLEEDFDAIAGDDGRIDEDDLEAALESSDPAVRDAAAFLLESDAARHALDVGAGRGDVDGEISLDDVRGLEQALDEGSLPQILADTADGEGGRDGYVSRDDLEALADDESVPADIRAWAEAEAPHAPGDRGCGGITDVGCHLGNAGEAVVDFATDPRAPHLAIPLGVYDGTVGTVVGIVDAAIHPIDTLHGLAYAGTHPFETAYVFGSTALSDFGENPIRVTAEAATQVIIATATSGSSAGVQATVEGVDAAATTAEVAEAGQDAREGAEVPGFVRFADRYIAPFTFPTARNPILGWLD